MQKRHLDTTLIDHHTRYKESLILLGPRQVGKSTILKKLFPDAHYLTLDNEYTRATLEQYDLSSYQQIITTSDKVVIIDEIQELHNPGRAAKIIYDQMPHIKLMLTGSSALNIKNKTSESLAGRKIDYQLFPLTLSEYLVQNKLEQSLNFDAFQKIITHKLPKQVSRPYDHQSVLNHILMYGLYPATIDHPNKELYLKNLIESTIFKDLIELKLLENRRAALSLLSLLALQIGSLTSYASLANQLDIDQRTVKRYIELFEQSFIIFRLYPYGSNKRDEIGKAPKVYFHDIGLRNALISNFNPLPSRADAGQLFENFIITEILKYNEYGNFGFRLNYWRTKSGSEIDLVLSKSDGTLLAVEIKNQSRRVNKSFVTRYPQAKMVVVSRHNYWV